MLGFGVPTGTHPVAVYEDGPPIDAESICPTMVGAVASAVLVGCHPEAECIGRVATTRLIGSGASAMMVGRTGYAIMVVPCNV